MCIVLKTDQMAPEPVSFRCDYVSFGSWLSAALRGSDPGPAQTAAERNKWALFYKMGHSIFLNLSITRGATYVWTPSPCARSGLHGSGSGEPRTSILRRTQGTVVKRKKNLSEKK